MDHTNVLMKWDDVHRRSIQTILSMLTVKHDYEKDFALLANWILATDINPYQFMPSGWEGSLTDAVSCCSFLQNLHHAMIDDGDVWAYVDGYSVFLEFCYPDDIPALYARRGHMITRDPGATPFEEFDVRTFIELAEQKELQWKEDMRISAERRATFLKGYTDGIK